jgi:hypothetical protein
VIEGVEEVAEWRWEGAGLFELQLALRESYLEWSKMLSAS